MKDAVKLAAFLMFFIIFTAVWMTLEYYQPPEWVWNVVLGPLGLVAVIGIFKEFGCDEEIKKNEGAENKVKGEAI